jgi:hypothetical protein
MLDRIATEILEQILKYACTDGGHTGNALAAVSRYVRGVSAPVRYHSVALCGARQIRAFLRLLDDIGRPTPPPPELGTLQRWKRRLRVGAGRPPLSARVVHIRHLFVADCARDRSTYDHSSDLMWTQWKDKAQTKRIEKSIIGNRGDVSVPTMRKRDRQRVVMNESERAAFSNAEAAITKLLSRVALSLQHLCYDQALPSRALCRVLLPALEELTCRVQSWTQRFHDSALGLNKRISFLLKLPALKHLHVVLKGMDWTTCFPRELPPYLERVRFSDSTDPGRLVHELAERKNSPWLTQDCLRIILLSRKHDDSYPPNFWQHQPILAQTIEYAQEDVLHKIIAVEDLEVYDLHRLHGEWLARVQGGEGCWKEGTPLATIKDTIAELM